MAYDELFGEKLILFDFCRSVVIIFFYYVLSLYDFDCNLTSIYLVRSIYPEYQK